MHVVVVGLLHLSQEAALLVHGLVTYQTLQHSSTQSDIFPIMIFKVRNTCIIIKYTIKHIRISHLSPRRTCLMSKSTVDVWFAGEVTEKVTRSFCWSTTADWLIRAPV